MLLYCNKTTPRLQYITNFTSKEIGIESFILTADVNIFIQHSGPKINYSNERITENEFWLKPHTLLFEKGINQQFIECFIENGNKVFFKTNGDFSFDIFSASFYLLSRYEEYLPHQKDMYGRYAHENSLAYKENFLHLPLIKLWLNDFKKALKQKFPSLTIHDSQFTFLPTYDIDEAYSYKHKGLLRSFAGIAKQLVSGKWSGFKERLNVLSGNSNDPYDSYQWMDKLCITYKLNPVYFFHVAANNGKYDKNILPSKPMMQQLIKQHAGKYTVGVHPSWKSGDEENLILQELKTLETITGKKITSSRQHYIRFIIPQTFLKLIDAGITDDYSMGYGSINGFRASVASSFYWYELEKEQVTNLLLHPFCFMDANSFYEQKLTAQQALEEMWQYYTIIKSVGGLMITLWHNNFFGTDKVFVGWKEAYEQFIKEIS